MPRSKTNVLVLFGGRSAEREVSCVSAAAIARHLGSKYRPILVRIEPGGRWAYQPDVKGFLAHPKPWRFGFSRTPARLELGERQGLAVGRRKIRVDVVFPALHGPYGEDGTLQGLLEFGGFAYVGSGVLGSALNMDKIAVKRAAAAAGLRLAPYAVLRSAGDLSPAKGLKYPLFVKPARLGSSVGVYKVKRRAELAAAARKAFRFDTEVVVEQGIDAREIECAVLGTFESAVASVPGEIRPNAEFYSYEAKYVDPQGAELLVPAPLSAAATRRVQAAAVLAFRELYAHGLGRVDFLVDRRTGAVYFNEINTMPGFTAISMYPKLWGASGIPFPRLIDRLIRIGLERQRGKRRLRITRD